MKEKRKHKRLGIKLELQIDSLFKQNNVTLEDLNVDINVVNISKSGIGFKCKEELPLNYYFNAKIELDEQDYFYAVIKIIRKEKIEDEYIFGCVFVGLAHFLADKVDKYEKAMS
ncbi:MAG: PilZ domain-containing protein [bacterium]